MYKWKFRSGICHQGIPISLVLSLLHSKSKHNMAKPPRFVSSWFSSSGKTKTPKQPVQKDARRPRIKPTNSSQGSNQCSNQATNERKERITVSCISNWLVVQSTNFKAPLRVRSSPIAVETARVRHCGRHGTRNSAIMEWAFLRP